MKTNNHISKKSDHGSVIATQMESFSGPLPHPAILQRYDEAVPGAADRIIAMAEREQRHRISMEQTSMEKSLQIAKVGQWLGFILLLLLIGVATYLTATGFAVVGGVIFGTTVLGIAVIFVLRKMPSNLPSAN